MKAEVVYVDKDTFNLLFWYEGKGLEISVDLSKKELEDLHKDMEYLLRDVWEEEYFPDE